MVHFARAGLTGRESSFASKITQALEVPEERNVKATVRASALSCALKPSMVALDNGVLQEPEAPVVSLGTFFATKESASLQVAYSDRRNLFIEELILVNSSAALRRRQCFRFLSVRQAQRPVLPVL